MHPVTEEIMAHTQFYVILTIVVVVLVAIFSYQGWKMYLKKARKLRYNQNLADVN